MIRIALVLAALAGCLKTTAFNCDVETDCARGGEQGVCEPTGFCSFVDATCPDGRRYGDLSGPFAGQCVGGTNMPDAPDPDAPDGPPAPFCDSAGEPTLVGCWEFEGNLSDASGDSNNGTGTSVTFATGQTGMAAQLVAASHIAVADSASLTPTSITIEGWINPTTLPGGATRMGVFDNNGQYGVFLQPGGVLCSTSVSLTVTVAIPTNVFTHVACTYDGATARAYIDGSAVGMLGGGTPLGAGDTTGAAIAGNVPSGDTLVGKIDQLRVWNAPRTPQQICAAAGKTSCP